MTAKVKAQKLVDRFNKIKFSAKINDSIEGDYYCDNLLIDKESIIECALIAAENIRTEMVAMQNYERAIYYRDVKQEIRNL